MTNLEELKLDDVLTIMPEEEIETPDDKEDAAWYELRNAFRTRRVLTGILAAIEDQEDSVHLAIVYYKEVRIAIPFSEMISINEDDPRYAEVINRQNRIVGRMLGCEIDFIIKGMDTRSRSVVASRKEAMAKKRRTFYLTPGANGLYPIRENRIVQARVMAVSEKVIRVEVFGVECTIAVRDLSWEWIGDCRDYYTVGEKILVRVNEVQRDDPENIHIQVDVRSLQVPQIKERLARCKVQARYAGVVTDVIRGTFYVRLSNGVNAIARTCYDSRMPAKKDEVSFVLTQINEEKNMALGVITRILRQHI